MSIQKFPIKMLRGTWPWMNFTQVRYGKSPAQTQKNYKRKQRVFSLRKNPGDWVDERMMIGTQKHLHFHPGLNVGINPRDKSLYAITAGTIYYSVERFNPNQKHPLVTQIYSNDTKLIPYYKKYVHVVPDTLNNQFQLVDLV